MKNAEQETREEMLQSPRVSTDLTGHEDHQDGLGLYDNDDETSEHGDAFRDGNVGQYNGRGTITEDGEFADGESDDGMDDDMMDKISSSPSIDDGGCPKPIPWPTRVDSLAPIPYFHLPFPLRRYFHPSKDHHHGRYPGADGQARRNTLYPKQGCPDLRTTSKFGKRSYNRFAAGPSEDEGYSSSDISVNVDNLLLPSNDLLDQKSDDSDDSFQSSFEVIPHINHEPLDAGRNFASHTRTLDTFDDDTKDISFSYDSRFIDSGFGGECLQETEDIDFEFVYALHTFVATVEGQANATKGDTMVLLDDSNSYWWLVRVVKDGSIGMSSISWERVN